MPVSFINAMTIPPGSETFFEEMWHEGYNHVSTQPGFVASSLHKNTLPDSPYQYYTVAIWENAQALASATNTPWWREFTERFGFSGSNPTFQSVPAVCEVLADGQQRFTA